MGIISDQFWIFNVCAFFVIGDRLVEGVGEDRIGASFIIYSHFYIILILIRR